MLIDYNSIVHKTDDEELTIQLLNIFLESLTERRAEFQFHLDEINFDGIMKTAHTLKGACGVISATPCKELMQQMEDATKEKDYKLCKDLYQQISDMLVILEYEIKKILAEKHSNI